MKESLWHASFTSRSKSTIWKRHGVLRERRFGFVEVQTGQVRDHTSRHLSDGAIDLALIKYDSEESAESRAAGLGPCIHHFGIEVDDMKVSAAELAKYGCEIISAPGVIPDQVPRSRRHRGGNLAQSALQTGERQS